MEAFRLISSLKTSGSRASSYRRLGRRFGRWAGFATVACLLIRALIPLGYMPGNALKGEYMVACPAGLPAATVTKSHHKHGKGGEKAVGSNRACSIGKALQSAALLPADTINFESSKTPVVSDVPKNDLFDTRFEARYHSRAPPLSRHKLS